MLLTFKIFEKIFPSRNDRTKKDRYKKDKNIYREYWFFFITYRILLNIPINFIRLSDLPQEYKIIMRNSLKTYFNLLMFLIPFPNTFFLLHGSQIIQQTIVNKSLNQVKRTDDELIHKLVCEQIE